MELVEKECTPGGNLNNWFQLFPDRKQASALRQLLQQQVEHPSIRLHTDTVPVKIERQDACHYAMELDNGARLEGNALLVTTGFRTFDASRKEEYGYGIYENVITSVELENYFANRQILTSTGKRPERIGLIQCVGSRDEKMCNFHCSKVCCITAAEILCFYMDMRMFGPGYEEMYREAQEKYNIKFVRGRLSEASENQAKQVVVKCEDTLVGKPMRRQPMGSKGTAVAARPQRLYPTWRPALRNQPHSGRRRICCRMCHFAHESDRHAHRCPFGSPRYRRVFKRK